MKAQDSSIATSPSPARPGKYLTFVLGKESYGVGILRVREILRPCPITPVPQVPPYILGVINLRGKIIPVLDLWAKFGLAAGASHERRCIVVALVKTAGCAGALMGLLVDAVEEVISLSDKDIEQAPDFGGRLDAKHLLGIAKVGSGAKILLDLDRIVADGTMVPA